jgi:hypothetical protein
VNFKTLKQFQYAQVARTNYVIESTDDEIEDSTFGKLSSETKKMLYECAIYEIKCLEAKGNTTKDLTLDQELLYGLLNKNGYQKEIQSATLAD